MFGGLTHWTVGLLASLMSVACVIAADTGAYFMGKSFGRTQLTEISPKKTVEGAAGGLACSMVVALAFHRLLQWPADPFTAALLGLLVFFASLFGDLIESVMKRDAGLKDASNIIPGHGGLLDRFDSYLFTGEYPEASDVRVLCCLRLLVSLTTILLFTVQAARPEAGCQLTYPAAFRPDSVWLCLQVQSSFLCFASCCQIGGFSMGLGSVTRWAKACLREAIAPWTVIFWYKCWQDELKSPSPTQWSTRMRPKDTPCSIELWCITTRLSISA